MVASTDVKFYVHTNKNIPQLQNAYGSMINVLDACLINGISIGAVSSLTASGTTVTALFSDSHNLKQCQVIKITGANQPEFNGEHRILTVPNAQSVTFELAATPSVSAATGTITASLPPLGWEKPFSSVNAGGGGKAAYRSTNLLLPSRPFLRVVDELDPVWSSSYAKYAKVGIVEDMTDIDTVLGVQAPFDALNPSKNWVGTGAGASAINGWAKWYYARIRNPTIDNWMDSEGSISGNKIWLLVGSSDFFYILPSQVDDTIANAYFFGAIESLNSTDAYNTALSASYNYNAANNWNGTAATTPCSNYSKSLLLQRPHDASEKPAIGSNTAMLPLRGVLGSGQKTMNADMATNGVNLVDVFISEYSASNQNMVAAMRGKMPSLKWIAQRPVLGNLSVLIDGDESYVFRDVGIAAESNGGDGNLGQVAFRLT